MRTVQFRGAPSRLLSKVYGGLVPRTPFMLVREASGLHLRRRAWEGRPAAGSVSLCTQASVVSAAVCRGRELPGPLCRQDEGVLTVGSRPCTVSAVGRPEKTAYLVKRGMIRRYWLVPLASGCWHLASWHWSNWEGVELLGQRTPVIHPVHARHPKTPTGS